MQWVIQKSVLIWALSNKIQFLTLSQQYQDSCIGVLHPFVLPANFIVTTK
jgi:hypothetical protein